MTRSKGSRRRQRGAIDTLPSGALRVRVYAGIDPVTKRRHDLIEVIPAGPTAEREAEQTRTRLLAQVDEKRSPRTRATVNQLFDRWLDVLDVEWSTRQGYVRKLDRHIRPVLGGLQVARLDAETLESFYATLRRCRERCGGRKYVPGDGGQYRDTDRCCGVQMRHQSQPRPGGPGRSRRRAGAWWG
jgi:integrase